MGLFLNILLIIFSLFSLNNLNAQELKGDEKLSKMPNNELNDSIVKIEKLEHNLNELNFKIYSLKNSEEELSEEKLYKIEILIKQKLKIESDLEKMKLLTK